MGTDEPTNTDTPEVTANLDEVEQALENGVDIDSPEITAKLEELKRRLGVTEQPEDQQQGPSQHMGSDVDWSEYDLDPKFAHLYPQSRLEMTEQGPRWVVNVTEFIAVKDMYDKIGRRITQMVNGPEGWRLQSAVVPVSNQHAVVTLQRIFPIILPTPMMLKTEETVTPPPPTEEELKVQEEQALAWANGQGTPPPPPATPAIAHNPNSLEEHIERVGNEVTEYQPTRANVVPGARAAAAEFVESRRDGDPDRPND